MFKFNFVTLLIISFITISTKVISQEINSVNIQELLLDIIDPNESMSKNIENLEKLNLNAKRSKVERFSVKLLMVKLPFLEEGGLHLKWLYLLSFLIFILKTKCRCY